MGLLATMEDMHTAVVSVLLEDDVVHPTEVVADLPVHVTVAENLQEYAVPSEFAGECVVLCSLLHQRDLVDRQVLCQAVSARAAP